VTHAVLLLIIILAGLKFKSSFSTLRTYNTAVSSNEERIYTFVMTPFRRWRLRQTKGPRGPPFLTLTTLVSIV